MLIAETLGEFLDFHADRRPDLLFADDGSQQYNFRQARERCLRIAASLQQQGIGKGDRVAILAKNSADNLITFLGCAYAGIVPVGLNYRLTAKEIGFIANDAGAKIIFYGKEFEPLLSEELEAQHCQCLDADGGLDSWFSADSEDFVAPQLAHEDELFQMYTSGTTGLPKGAVLRHSNVLSSCMQAILTSGEGINAGDRVLIIAPTYHTAGLMTSLLSVVCAGSMVIHTDYDPVGMIDTLEKDNITAVTVVPIMLQFSIMMVPDIRERDFSSLRLISYGANPIDASLLRDCIDIFGCSFSQGYGQTEATSILTNLTPADHLRALNGQEQLLQSCGRAVLGTELKIVDSEGNELPRGEKGEILGKGPQVMSGYWNRAEANAKTIVDGWLHTGDAGYMDEEGYIFIQDRLKDLIISGGENIYPAEIEQRLREHPEIQDAAVIALKDDQWGEVPQAILVAAPKEDGPSLLDVDAVQNWCKDSLAGFKLPKAVHYVDDLPRNPTGKVLKKVLREQFAA